MSSSPHIAPVNLRPASVNDCAHLVLFADMATRRLTSFLWALSAWPGQSAFEVGRNIIRNDSNHFTHFQNWLLADINAEIVGGFNGYIIPVSAKSPQAGPEHLVPLNELKAMVVGSWYISALAIYPEHQRKGLGSVLLAEAERLARIKYATQLSLLVGSFNSTAYALYKKAGFAELDRRQFLPFPGSDEQGEWVLMAKDLV
ncbi:GNAT family N-acetyltransferase [Rhizobium sp. FKY42]|uniref:GNAT family N-acetyltransferase n=1 Tax=Rhizobium sp. FKY42 TaxID=2562310 RepID=UPI0010C0C69D|nr:GNAT family N-acetyltransferase [Rhizobium sp. FKY42]